MNTKMIETKEHFRAKVCNNCKLCNKTHFRGDWCWAKFVENRSAFLSRFIQVVVSARGSGKSMAYFRQGTEFKRLFCDPDQGACLLAFDCQGGIPECYNAYYNQLIGSPYSPRTDDGYGCGWPMNIQNDEDAFNEHLIALRAQHQTPKTTTTVVKRDKTPFIFTSTGKRFLNRVEKILEDRHKPKRRSRKSSTKADTPVKRKVNTSKPAVLRSSKGRKKNVGDSKTHKTAEAKEK